MQLDVADTLDHWTKPPEGLLEDPLTNPEEIWYTDGSSFVLDVKRARYAVVSNFETIEAKPFPPVPVYRGQTLAVQPGAHQSPASLPTSQNLLAGIHLG